MVRRPLHNYQLEPARAIVDSVLHKRGLEFAVMFPRQSGKNETQAQVEAYLLNLFQRVKGAQIVKAQPTFQPQQHSSTSRASLRVSSRACTSSALSLTNSCASSCSHGRRFWGSFFSSPYIYTQMQPLLFWSCARVQ